MNTQEIRNQLTSAISQTSVDCEIQTMLIDRFTPFLDQAREWGLKASELVVTDINQTREMKMAREARLAMREIRINADKLRKELKEDSLRYGRAVQGVYNVIEAAISPIEKHLEAQEKFREIYEMNQREALRLEREALVQDVRAYMISNINLGEINEQDFQRMWTGAILQRNAAEQEARKAEEERIAKAKAEEQERERLRQENERLKAEAEALQNIRIEAERKASEERAERERIELELRIKKDAEEKLEADKQAAIESDLAKGDAQKLSDFIADMRALQIKYHFKSKKYKEKYNQAIQLIEKIVNFIQ